MKIIITGATGFVGATVMKQCIADPRISEIIAAKCKISQSSRLRGVSVECTLAAVEAFAGKLAESLPRTPKRKFPFVFCSGRGAEQDETKSLWLILSTSQKVKGAVEKRLLDLARAYPETFETLIVRLGVIISEETRVMCNEVPYAIASVLVSDIANVMVDLCVEGSDHNILENENIVRRSQIA